MPRNKTAAAEPAVIEETETETSPGPADGMLAPAGDGGAREEEVSAAQAGFDALHEDLDLLHDGRGAVVRHGTDFVLEMLKHRPKPWTELSQAEQRDLIAGIESNVHELVRQIVEAVRAADEDSVRCLFVGFTDKGDDIKAELKVKAFSKEETEAAVIALHRARGKHVLVTVASAEDFHDEPANDRSEPEQRALGFEAGSDEHPEDDSDLVDAADEDEQDERRAPLPADTSEIVRTGDQLIVAQKGICAARISLKTSMVEACAPDSEVCDETSWFDIREASPAELAQERERIADFEEATA